MSIALTNGATATNFQAGDKAIWAMCVPTDVTTPAQFSAEAVTATGATFATATEINEPDSAVGNDIGGYSAYAHVNSGSSTTAPTVTATLAGTLTNVRGPVVLLRVRETVVPVTHDTSGVLAGQVATVVGAASNFTVHATSGLLTGQGASIVGSADHASGTVTHATTGALTGQSSTTAGSAARFRAHAATGALIGPGSTTAGTARHNTPHATTGALTGQGTTVAGSAARSAGPVAHPTSGALTGPGTLVTGAATRFRTHTSTGALAGQNAIIVGSAARFRTHTSSGALAGSSPKLLGSAARLPLLPDPSDVREGLIYGPGGTYTGTLAASNGGTVMLRRR